MGILSSTSLSKKLTLSALALTAGSILLITSVVYLTVLSFGENFLENELEEKSEFIKKALTEPIWTYDQHQIEEVGNSLLIDSKYTYITALKIETNEHSTLFEKGINNISSFSLAQKLPYTKTKNIKLFKGKQYIATISIAMTNEGYIVSIRNQLGLILVVSLLMLLLVSQLVRYYYNQTLTTPLNKILGQVSRIENEDYRLVMEEGLPDELATVSRALNQAASMIEKRNNDIMYYTNDLEKLVQERTAELEDQMSKNLNTARLAAVGEMAADVAHEINNPLTVIDLHINKLKKHEVDYNLPLEAALSVTKVQAMVKRIAKIIKGLKSLSRDGNADPKVPFSIVSMVEDVKMLVEMKIKSHDINFDITIDDYSLMAEGREVQISQVLVNLIGNAVDAIIHSPESRWITLTVKDRGDMIYFYVTDSGDGIPEGLQEKIMRPFFTTKELNKGTGLGLSISKGIIEEHEGVLEYNTRSRNTQFIFTLKKVQAALKSA